MNMSQPYSNTFEYEDLYFRTLTTIMQTVNSIDHRSYEWSPPRDVQKTFRRMLAVSALLTRGTAGVVATMSKRSLEGILLFCMEDKKRMKSSHMTPHELLLGINPREGQNAENFSSKVSLLPVPALGNKNAVDYILSIWGASQPFEEHAAYVANLIVVAASQDSSKSETTTSKTSGVITCSSEALQNLHCYVVFQNIDKILRRLRCKKMLVNHFQRIAELDISSLGLSNLSSLKKLVTKNEMEELDVALRSWGLDIGAWPQLKRVVFEGIDALTDPLAFLQEYVSVLQTGLRGLLARCTILHRTFIEFNKTTTSAPMPDDLAKSLRWVVSYLQWLRFLGWESSLFENLMSAVFKSNLPLQTAFEDQLVTSSGGDSKVGDVQGDDQTKEDGNGNGGEDDDGDEVDDDEPFLPSKIPEARNFRTAPPDMRTLKSEYVYWARLVSAPVQYVTELWNQATTAKRLRLTFQVVSHPVPSKPLLPWRDVIRNMYPTSEDADATIDELIKVHGTAKKTKPNGDEVDVMTIFTDPNYQFSGTAHCEAILASLHYNANTKSAEKQHFSQEALDAAANSTPLVAPSKRCCPGCAVIQDELRNHVENRAGLSSNYSYQVYFNHAHVSGCAFPVGLPREVRLNVIQHFEKVLRVYLNSIKLRSSSAASAESQPFSPNSPHQTREDRTRFAIDGELLDMELEAWK